MEILKIVLLFSILGVLIIIAVHQKQINRENMSFWIHNEDRTLISNISQETKSGLGLKRTETEMELHSLFQFISALYKQRKFGNINDENWDAMLNGFSFLINSEIGKEYWRKIKHQLWPKDFIELGDSLLKDGQP